MAQDDNDLAKAGKLPVDPRENTKVVAEAPRIRCVNDLLSGSMERAFSKEERRVCTTGHYLLDEMTGGFLPGWCWLLAANTNWGKSTFAISVADENLRLGYGVLIISLEDAEELYADRLMLRRCRRSEQERVSADNMRLRRLQQSERSIIVDVVSKAERKPIFLDARGQKGEWIAKQLERILDELPIDLVILDYMGEVRSSSRRNSRREEMTDMASEIRGVIKCRKRSGLFLSQVTIDSDNEGKFPRMSQVRDSRDIVNAAEVVAMAGIPSENITDKRDPGKVKVYAGERALLLEKVKQGRKGFVSLPWDNVAACFLPVRGPRSNDSDPSPSDPDPYDDLDSAGDRMGAGF